MPAKPRIAIIGAGPIGLEAALYARLRGHDVTVYERGRIADNVRQWGHVKMFSPFGMNSSEWGRGALSTVGHQLPDDEAILTGHQYYGSYLKPISRLAAVRSELRLNTSVKSVARSHLLKRDLIGDPQRADDPFWMLLEDDWPPGSPWTSEAEIILDCSGTFGYPNGILAGGLTVSVWQWPWQLLDHHLPDVTDRLRNEYAGRRVVVLGAGYSAATNVVALSEVQRVESRTSITWVTRTREVAPIRRIPNDTLAERERLANRANALVAHGDSGVDWIGGHVVRGIEWEGDDDDGEEAHEPSEVRLVLEELTSGSTRVLTADRIIANVGYRPDRSLYEELQVHECYATQGPMKLAAKLLGETSADCLDQTSHGAEVLRNAEPNFYILGMKSYGRNSNFLIRIGLQQIVDVFTLIKDDWGV